MTLAGVAIGFATGRHAPRPAARRRMGALLLSLPAIAVVALVGLLAHSQRGLTGSISHDVSALTDPNAPLPANTPGRLTSVGSVRARYWNEALEVFSEHPALGAGAGGYATARLRHRTETLDVTHAHGYLVQTLADLGLVGLALTLALLAAWLAAAGRATHPWNRRWHGGVWRRIQRALLRRAHRPADDAVRRASPSASTRSWTGRGTCPGDACVALLCAGWLAGRGPLDGDRHDGSADAGDTAHGGARSREPPRGAAPGAMRSSPAVPCSSRAAWPPGRSGSRCARSTPPTRRSRCSRAIPRPRARRRRRR